MNKELKMLTDIFNHDLKVTIKPYKIGKTNKGVTFRIDGLGDYGEAFTKRYILPVIAWQDSSVQEPELVSMMLAKMIDEFVREVADGNS